MIRNELLKKHQEDSLNENSLVEKEQEIYNLRDEVARLKSMISSQKLISASEAKPSAKSDTSLEMLLRNSDSFANDYLRNLNLKPSAYEKSLYEPNFGGSFKGEKSSMGMPKYPEGGQQYSSSVPSISSKFFIFRQGLVVKY